MNYRILLLWCIVLFIVPSCEDGGGPVVADDDDASDADAGDDDDTAADDDTSGDDDTTGCDDLPAGPLDYTVLAGPKATEDFAFDGQGYMIGADWGGSLLKSTYDGDSQLWVPNAGSFISGIRALPSGDIVYSESDEGTLFRVDSNGTKTAVLSGLSYPNGVEVDLDGYVYVTEHDAGNVRRVDPYTGEFTIIAQGLTNPNGVTFSPDYSTLYIGSFGGGTIHTLEMAPDGTPGELTVLVQSVGNGQLDGMGVDICGNIYVCEFIAARVWRISPDGQTQEPVVMLGDETDWIPNLQWGSGIGGWDPMKMYVQDIQENRMYEVEIGVPGKERPFP